MFSSKSLKTSSLEQGAVSVLHFDACLEMPALSTPLLNREPELASLTSSFLTDISIRPYDRNHCPIPDSLDASTHRVRVDGLVSNSLNLSISDLRNSFPQHDVTCVLQCAGNRRHTMRTLLKEVDGVDWGSAAVMNCTWRGPRLRDVLLKAAPTLADEDRGERKVGDLQQELHVAFACNAVPCQDDSWYGASILMDRALRENAEVILALEMNGAPLTQEHGFPVRVIVPGVAGARAVKWLDHITVQREMSSNHYMHFDYKVLPPEAVDAERARTFWHKVPPVIDMPANSAITSPRNGDTVEVDAEGFITVDGYALPGGEDGPVKRVEVSIDKERWVDAELFTHPMESKWTWKTWKAKVQVEPGERRCLYSRTTDEAGNSQPQRSQWNLRGVCYNGYGEVRNLKVVKG